jgi:hypothetical protein
LEEVGVSKEIPLESPWGRAFSLTMGITFLVLAYLYFPYIDDGLVYSLMPFAFLNLSAILLVVGVYPKILPTQEQRDIVATRYFLLIMTSAFAIDFMLSIIFVFGGLWRDIAWIFLFTAIAIEVVLIGRYQRRKKKQ